VNFHLVLHPISLIEFFPHEKIYNLTYKTQIFHLLNNSARDILLYDKTIDTYQEIIVKKILDYIWFMILIRSQTISNSSNIEMDDILNNSQSQNLQDM